MLTTMMLAELLNICLKQISVLLYYSLTSFLLKFYELEINIDSPTHYGLMLLTELSNQTPHVPVLFFTTQDTFLTLFPAVARAKLKSVCIYRAGVWVDLPIGLIRSDFNWYASR